MNSLFTVDTQMLEAVFSFWSSKLNMDMSSLISVASRWICPTAAGVMIVKEYPVQSGCSRFRPYSRCNGMACRQFSEIYGRACTAWSYQDEWIFPCHYLQSDSARALIQKEMSTLSARSKAVGGWSTAAEADADDHDTVYIHTHSTAAKELSTRLQSQLGHLANLVMRDAIQIDASWRIFQGNQMNMNEEELFQADDVPDDHRGIYSSYDGNLKNLGYADLDKPGGISSYRRIFEKQARRWSMYWMAIMQTWRSG